MLDYTAHMSSIQAKYFNRDEEEKSGTKMRCGVQVGGAPGVRFHRHRSKNTVYFTYPPQGPLCTPCGTEPVLAVRVRVVMVMMEEEVIRVERQGRGLPGDLVGVVEQRATALVR